MKRSTITSWVLGGTMLLSAWATVAITPTVKLSDSRPPIVLAQSIPERFGDWQVDKAQVAAVVNPTTVAELNKIYAETLSRTYVNSSGERIMLSIAYGTDQRDDLAVHFPEGCYGGQGFAVEQTVHGQLATGAGNIPVARTVATLNSRIEPITYWVVVGNRAVPTSWEVKKEKLAYAMRGLIPDATLMRVSNITADKVAGYRLQEQFVAQLMGALPPASRSHFSGTGD